MSGAFADRPPRGTTPGLHVAIATALLLAGGCTAAPVEVGGLAPDSLTVGLVAHWRLDETAGTTAHDTSGNGHDGLVQGSATWAAGQFGGGLHLVPPGSVAVGSFPQATSSWSVSLWARPTSGWIATTPFATLLGNAFGPGGWDLNMVGTPSGPVFQLGYWVGPEGYTYAILPCDCVAMDQWSHLAVTIDAATMTAAMYRDGALAVTVPVPRLISPGSPTLFIGGWAQAERYFAGGLDDIAIYRRALVSEEIDALARAAAPDPR